MGARAVAIKQADITRAIRAVQAAGLPVVRVVIQPRGVVVETVVGEPAKGRPWEPDYAADEVEEIVI